MCFAKIDKLENGYEVEVRDPVIVAANQKLNSKWRDPCKEYVFKDLKSALKWIADNESKIAPDDAGPSAEFSGAWNEAMTEDK